jgi:hypothetical protein
MASHMHQSKQVVTRSIGCMLHLAIFLIVFVPVRAEEHGNVKLHLLLHNGNVLVLFSDNGFFLIQTYYYSLEEKSQTTKQAMTVSFGGMICWEPLLGTMSQRIG